MKWLKKVITNWVREDWDNVKEPMANLTSTGRVRPTPQEINSNGMNFTVYRANGGHIIEHRIYDKRTDRTTNGLHIITDDKDLGEEIGKIITYEQLRS
jgi:hypothetical protein